MAAVRDADPTSRGGPIAVVMGDVDLVRALALAAVPSALFAPPRAPARLSRSVVARVPWHDHWREPAAAAAEIDRFAASLPERPVLMPQSDGDLLVASRHREQLARHCAFLLADAETVESLVDKERFAELAASTGLRTPRTHVIDARSSTPDGLDVRFPLVVKPLQRDTARWAPVGAAAKARHVEDSSALRALWPELEAADLVVLAQEAIAGPESAIESFHAYVDADGRFVAGFTGRKIRTWPLRYGHTTALEITAAADVTAHGRDVIERLAVVGPAKVDFKRDPTGHLHLLEVNPRFTLWHHAAAVAGLNIPAIVHADLTGRPRPSVAAARPGVRWCLPHRDLRAARAAGVGLRHWLAFLRACDARSGLASDDPLPFLPGVLWNPLARRLRPG